MASLHAVFLDANSVRKISQPILEKRLGPYKLGEIDVREDEMLDGDPILRMDVSVGKKVPARTLIEANADIHVALRSQGEERFVFLSTKPPLDDEQEPDEDEE